MEEQQQHDTYCNVAQPDKDSNDVLLNTFLISNKKYRVLLLQDNLTWEKENSQNEKTTVPLVDILAVRLDSGSRRNNGNIGGSRISVSPSASSVSAMAVPSTASVSDSVKNYLYVYYAKRESDFHRDHNRWRKKTVKLYNTDFHILQKWYDCLNHWLEQQKRPKNILMFINPYGGRKQALKVFEKYSKPLFQLAGVEVSCLISQRSNQIHDILLNNQALDQYDAICCVGGDGTFAEVFNGLMKRTLRDLDLDPRRPEYLPKLRIPIGVIPAGSTDTVAYCLHGTTDVKTAVIHIILGQTGGLDLSSICNQDGFVKLYASLVCYGYLGDIALESEQYRWMGPRRYDYCGFKKFVANHGYEVELSFDDTDLDSSTGNCNEKSYLPCNIGCPRCSRFLNTSEKSHFIDYSQLKTFYDDRTLQSVTNSGPHYTKQLEMEQKSPNWKTIRGKYFMIAGANISCSSTRSPNGLAPFCHLGDGNLDIIVVRHTHVFNLLRLLLRLKREHPKLDMLPFVDVYRTNKFVVRSPKPYNEATSSSDLANMTGSCQPISNTKKSSEERTSQWNCDGEIIFETDVLISSHRQLVDVFMRGSSPRPEQNKISCCGLCSS